MCHADLLFCSGRNDAARVTFRRNDAGNPHIRGRAIGTGGHIALIGIFTGGEGTIPTMKLMGKLGRLQGITVGSRRDQLDMIAAIEANGIRPVIDRRFPLDALAEAFRHQESGAHLGKVVVEIG